MTCFCGPVFSILFSWGRAAGLPVGRALNFALKLLFHVRGRGSQGGHLGDLGQSYHETPPFQRHPQTQLIWCFQSLVFPVCRTPVPRPQRQMGRDEYLC